MKTYRGQADVAQWCNVTTAAVSNWMARHPDKAPEPDVEIVTEGARNPIRGWLPGRRAEWEQFAAERMAHPVVAGKRTRKTADLIYQQVQEGRIDAAEAVKLLHELI